MNWSLTILLGNVVSTLFMVGLIWMVQIVHYPLFAKVGDDNFVSYHHSHQNNITFVVGPIMLIELSTAVLLLWNPVDGVDRSLIYIDLGLAVLIWLSTAAIQVPCHGMLANGFELRPYKLLIYSNWIRTIAWTVRGALVTAMLYRVLTK